ncbi:MAG: glycosyltransferase family 2 protein [bacterium]|nr:glycosyltransferase family 2 protein [bacterium]
MTRAPGARVSVVVPVRDGARHLGAALDSVLAQGDRVGEIVVVDDGSSDDSVAVARSRGPLVRVIAQPPSGVGPARNRGAAAASHPLLAFLDADDLWPDDRLAGLCAVLEAAPELDAVFGLVEEFFTPELDAAVAATMRCKPLGAAMLPGGMLIWRDAFARHAGFAARGAEFVAWFVGARDGGLRWRVLDTLVLRRRLHDRNRARVDPRVAADYLRIARERVAGRRP